MPSSSARCAQLPRALDKVPFYTALRKFRDYLKGTLAELKDEDISFQNLKIKNFKNDPSIKMESNLGDLEPCIRELQNQNCHGALLDNSMIKEEELEETRLDDLEEEEITKIPHSLFHLNGMTREQLESLDCPTIPIRKKRGRPKKTPDDPNAPPRPRPRPPPTELMMCNGEEPPRKKRGRPKKVLEDGRIPSPKRPGRKPKALKEMLAAQHALALQQGQAPGALGHQSSHSLSLNHINGIMSPQGFSPNPNGPTFSPQYGSSQSGVHSAGTPNPLLAGVNPILPGSQSSIHQQCQNSLNGQGNQSGGGSQTPGHSSTGGQTPGHGCHTPGHPTGNHTPVHPPGGHTPTHNPGTPGHTNPLSARGQTPQHFGQSPGYSPGPVGSAQQAPTPYSMNADNSSDIQTEEEHQLGLSPPPASPVMAQPDFEPPTSMTENDTPLVPSAEPLQPPPSVPNNLTPSHQDEQPLGLLDQPQHTPNVGNQFSNPGTPVDGSSTPYQSYPSYSSTIAHSPSVIKPQVHSVQSPKIPGKSDVSSKSLSGLESLVDQIPSLNEHETSSQHSAHSNSAPCSNPTTPGPPSGPAPFSPSHITSTSNYQNYPSGTGSGSGGGAGHYSVAHYGSPQSSHYGSPQSSHPYSPHYSSNSTNLSTNFSVSSLANSSLTTSLSYSSGYEMASQTSSGSTSTSTTSSSTISSNNSSSFSVSSLTGGSPPPASSMYSSNSYSPHGPSPHSSYPDIEYT